MIVEAILPTFRRDLAQYEILRDSLKINQGDLSRCIIVAPDTDIEAFPQGGVGDPFAIVPSIAKADPAAIRAKIEMASTQ